MLCRIFLVGLILLGLTAYAVAQTAQRTIEPLARVVDLNLGDSREVVLCNGKKVKIELLDLQQTSDSVRMAQVKVEIDGNSTWLSSARKAAAADDQYSSIRVDGRWDRPS
jgi:hypothetical protein